MGKSKETEATEEKGKQSTSILLPFEHIEIDSRIPNSRTIYRGIEELAANIAEHGLLENLVVRGERQRSEKGAFELPDGTKVWTRYFLVAGNRRYRAIKLIRETMDPAAFEKIQVTVRKGNLDDALFDNLNENVQREDLTPPELAAALVGMVKRGHSQSDIARRLSKSPSWVSRLCSFHEQASEPLRKAAAAGEVSFSTAQVLATLPEEEQVKEVETIVSTGVDKRKQADRGARARAANGGGTASANVSPRKGLKEIRGYYEHLKGTDLDTKIEEGTPEWGAMRALGWMLGEGAWPKGFPKPKKADVG